jgi:hypothetical protein
MDQKVRLKAMRVQIGTGRRRRCEEGVWSGAQAPAIELSLESLA